jgi:hypothetical protein
LIIVVVVVVRNLEESVEVRLCILDRFLVLYSRSPGKEGSGWRSKTASQQKPTTRYAEAANFISNVVAPIKESADHVLVKIEQPDVALIPSNNGPRPLRFKSVLSKCQGPYSERPGLL